MVRSSAAKQHHGMAFVLRPETVVASLDKLIQNMQLTLSGDSCHPPRELVPDSVKTKFVTGDAGQFIVHVSFHSQPAQVQVRVSSM